MFSDNRIVPELYTREDDTAENEQDSDSDTDDKPKPKIAADVVMGAVHKFSAQRQALKERIVSEVMDAAFPDMDDFNVDDFVVGKTVPPKPNQCVRCLQFFGCLSVTVHQAVENGSMSQLEDALMAATEKVEKDLLPSNFIDELNASGHTALAAAVRTRQTEMVEALLVYKANPNIVDENTGMAALMYSVSNGSLPITTNLLRYGADPNLTDFKGTTALMIAASLGDVTHCRVLVMAGSNIDFVDKHGWSALHYAALGGSVEVCDFLLNEGVDKDLKDFKRRKAIHIARHLNHGTVVAFIEGYRRRIM